MMNQSSNNLSPAQEQVLKNKATEPPFSGVLNDNKKPGTYICGNCGSELFSSQTKFESGSGWPSFTDVVSQASVDLVDDYSHGMVRQEVVCSVCKGHLGHMFEYGNKLAPKPIYCINSAALNFVDSENNEMIRGDGENNEAS